MSDCAYSNAVASALSANLIDKKTLVQLADGNLSQFFDALNSTSYAGRFEKENFENFVDSELDLLAQFVLKECENLAFKSLFLLPNDFKNFCACLIARRLGLGEDMFFATQGFFNKNAVFNFISTKNFDQTKLPHLQKAIEEFFEIEKENLIDFEADNIFKQHLFQHLKDHTKDEFVKKLLNFVLDIENIQIAYRCDTIEMFEHQKLPFGEIDSHTLLMLVQKNKECENFVQNSAFVRLFKILLGESSQKHAKFEVQKRVELLNFALEFESNNQTCAPFVCYVFKKKYELENLRTIHNFLACGMNDQIKSNLVFVK